MKLAAILALILALTGCCGYSGSSGGERYTLNGAYASETVNGLVVLDFNYTPERTLLPEISFNFGSDFFEMNINGVECEFAPRGGWESKSHVAFMSRPTQCADGRKCNSFYIGRIMDEKDLPLRVVVDGFVDENCAREMREGANVSFSLSSVENQNDLGEVLDPYRETVSGELEMRNITGYIDVE